MAKYHIGFLVLIFVIGQINPILMNSAQTNKFSLSLRNFNAWNAVSGVISRNLTENNECLIELRAIKNGLEKHQEWAMRGRFFFEFLIIYYIF